MQNVNNTESEEKYIVTLNAFVQFFYKPKTLKKVY